MRGGLSTSYLELPEALARQIQFDAMFPYIELRGHRAELNYRGCGHGWILCTPAGAITKLRYADALSDPGAKEQNIYCANFDPDSNQWLAGPPPAPICDPPGAFIETSGGILLMANFSVCQAVLDGLADGPACRKPRKIRRPAKPEKRRTRAELFYEVARRQSANKAD